MPNRAYTPEEKKLVRRLLLVHNGNIAIIHQLTGFPERTIRHWRRQWDDDYQFLSHAFAGNSPLPAMANDALKQPAIPSFPPDSAIAENTDSIAELTHLRATLMEHATTLADTLLAGDGLVHQRVQAVSRLLDRILALDEILPNRTTDPACPPQTEQTIRWEFYYHDDVHVRPPWEEHDMQTKEGFMSYAESYLLGSIRDWNHQQQLSQGILDPTYGDDDYDAYLDELRERLDYQVSPLESSL